MYILSVHCAKLIFLRLFLFHFSVNDTWFWSKNCLQHWRTIPGFIWLKRSTLVYKSMFTTVTWTITIISMWTITPVPFRPMTLRWSPTGINNLGSQNKYLWLLFMVTTGNTCNFHQSFLRLFYQWSIMLLNSHDRPVMESSKIY